ncbi:methyltransferase regulatory domain-containing protein [Limnoglobus roseus]|nr:class I SAM-dependent methyltransferase [Limnoglobus roseus]
MMSTPPAVNPVAPATLDTYDEVPYESHPFSQTHPSRLFVVGTLFGLRPVPVQRCRVLELGCASGGNLIPMADMFPESQFVGVDLSARQIEDGQKQVAELGLKNLTLRHASIADIDVGYGMFDYIICHGVFSWVPNHVQEKIYDIFDKNMNANGIAYVSYNTYPGWHMRGMIRDMMRYHSGRFNTPQLRTQQSRALLDFLAQSVKQEGPYSQLLKAELETLRHQADHYLYHEHLEENNEPLYFHQFMTRAAGHNLRYLGEARVGTMVTGNFGPDIEKTLKILATDQIQAEQYMDFLRNRMFRETLLVHNKVNPVWSVQPEALRTLHVASGARPTTPVTDLTNADNVQYKSNAGMQMATSRPLLKAVMQVLNEAFPGTVPFDVLRKTAREKIGGDANDPKLVAEDTNVVAIGLLNCYMSSDLIELHGMPITISRKVDAKPTALKWARMQAARGVSVTNRRHEVLRLNDLDRHLLPLLDGQKTKDQIIEGLAQVSLSGQLNVQKDNITLSDPKDINAALSSVIDQALQKVADQALMTH